MGLLEENWPRNICLGHKIYEKSPCDKCSEDYRNHFPNNFDCKIYKNFISKYEKLEKFLKENEIILEEETLEMVATQIFLATIIDPSLSPEKILKSLTGIKEIRNSLHYKVSRNPIEDVPLVYI